ncbi:glycosyltransferase [Nocardioides caeni]|uniref:Glycosyltransferase n=1 Tax=Nocardioides caeni TaxID=574700 RepID=A0A4S8NNV3_9ACTN|nr:glycosyltransferase [Nocardioides caeni]THV18597.1 glycosyltransferase [Nocardioides caeni]
MLQIVIPAFNEEARLPRTLRELRRHVVAHRGELGRVEVLVVDNASTDGTAEVARAADSTAMPVRVVRCQQRGKGAAVRAGLLASDAALVCFMDADGATAFDALERSWARVMGGADVVIASRGLAESTTTARHCKTRSRGAAAYRRLAHRMLPGISDTQCGFKLFRGDLVRSVVADLRTAGFSFDVELLVLLQAAGARIEELPVTWVDVPGSTFVPARHGASAFAELGRIAWRNRRSTVSGKVAAGLRAPLPAPAALPAAVVLPFIVAATADLHDRGRR